MEVLLVDTWLILRRSAARESPNNARAILLPESVADIQVERQSEPWKIFQGECQDDSNLVFASPVVSRIQAQAQQPSCSGRDEWYRFVDLQFRF